MDKQILDFNGEVSNETDLWCTYAAVRTYSWMGYIHKIEEKNILTNFLLSRRNADGGYAWSAGMSSDLWATYYCTQSIKSLNSKSSLPVKYNDCEKWIRTTQNIDGGFGMMPGQSSDVWATYYAVRTLVEICGKYPDLSFKNWLSELQTSDGGLTWSPEHAKNSCMSDVRACYYAITAWMVGTNNDKNIPWNKEKLLTWLKNQQSVNGGFRFQKKDNIDCLWATFRATYALALLDDRPKDTKKCIQWIRSQIHPNGSFTRWPEYPIQDVWAAFCGIGSLKALNNDIVDLRDNIALVLENCRISNGGFSYRELLYASDTLSTASKILSKVENDIDSQNSIKWIEQCVMPNENGIMYMPGRGSEVRCSLWGICAGAFSNFKEIKHNITEWLIESIRNPDGGFGYWEGRASDVISTTAAIELIYLTKPEILKNIRKKAEEFFESCRFDEQLFRNVPGGKPSLRSTLQTYRALNRLGCNINSHLISNILDQYKVKGGGFANEGNRFPDLLSTYEAILTSDTFNIDIDYSHLKKFIDSIKLDSHRFSWSPIVKIEGGKIANCFGKNLDLRCIKVRLSIPPILIS